MGNGSRPWIFLRILDDYYCLNGRHCNDYPPELVDNSEMVEGTSTSARKVIRKYVAMTPASSYSYVAIVAWVLLIRDPGVYRFPLYEEVGIPLTMSES